MIYQSTKVIDLGSCAFRQWKADHSHCHYVHGYRLQAKFWFGCTELDNKNWVVDFGGLKELKTALEKQFDHTLCVAADDPLIDLFKQLHSKGGCDLRIMDRGVGIERTAEWCFETANNIIKQQTGGRCWVEKVEVWEHDKNSAVVQDYKQIPVSTGNTLTQPLEQTPVATVVAAPAYELQQTKTTTIQPQIDPIRPANVGNVTSTGWGDVFKGTTWGA